MSCLTEMLTKCHLQCPRGICLSATLPHRACKAGAAPRKALSVASAGKSLRCRRTKTWLQMGCICCTNHSGNHSTLLAVASQCWTAGKEEIWGLWLRACFITTDPAELCKAKIKSRPDVPVHPLWGSRPKAGNSGTTDPHDASIYPVVAPGCRNFGQRKAWAGHRSVKLTGLNLAQKYVEEPHEEGAKEPLPVCPGHRPWPQH